MSYECIVDKLYLAYVLKCNADIVAVIPIFMTIKCFRFRVPTHYSWYFGMFCLPHVTLSNYPKSDDIIHNGS